MSSRQALQLLRDDAWQAFARLGLPDRRCEDWKYTDLSRIAQLLGAEWWQAPASDAEVDPAATAIEGLDAYRVTLIDGVFAPAW